MQEKGEKNSVLQQRKWLNMKIHKKIKLETILQQKKCKKIQGRKR